MSAKHDPITEAYLDALMDPPDVPDNSYEAIAFQIIQDSPAWLQSTPRTLQEIAAHLFPDEMDGTEHRENFLLMLISHLLGNGYHAAPKVDAENEWVWLKALNSQQSEIWNKNTPLGKVTPPLFIRRGAPPSIHKSEEEGVDRKQGYDAEAGFSSCLPLEAVEC
jgi:hypothetical protein